MWEPWFYLGLVFIAFSGYPRGTMVRCETGYPRHHSSNFTVETRSRTRVSQVPVKPPRGLEPRDGTEPMGTLKLFVGSDICYSRVIEILLSVPFHADPFHYSDRSYVSCCCKRHALPPSHRSESHLANSH